MLNICENSTSESRSRLKRAGDTALRTEKLTEAAVGILTAGMMPRLTAETEVKRIGDKKKIIVKIKIIRLISSAAESRTEGRTELKAVFSPWADVPCADSCDTFYSGVRLRFIS